MSKLYQALTNNARQFPSSLAIVEGDTRWTYPDFLAQVDKAASGFKARNVQPGDRVGLMLYNQKEFLVCFFALRKIGAVVVPINIQMLPQDIGFVIQNSGIRTMVVDSGLHAHVAPMPLQFILVGATENTENSYESFLSSTEEAPPVESPEGELAFLLYTSGTTGHPKGVMLSEKNVLANITGFEAVADFSKDDRILLALPLFHAFGLIIALAGLVEGTSLILVPKFHPKRIAESLVGEKATILPLVPTLFTVILEIASKMGGLQVPDLRFCISGGASLPAQLLHRIEQTLSTMVLEGYGLTETAPVLAVNDPKVGSIPGCVGKPLPNVQIRILSEDGQVLPTGEVGEIVAKGDNIMSGYYHLPEETQAVFTHDGWFRTGDLGHLDEEGRLYISGGRKKDLIIKAGENISPLSIEEVLYRYEAVREVAVVGVPHEKLGEEIAACISLNEGASATAQDVIRFCREHLTATYVPGSVMFFDELPKNPSGKIVKKLLREQLAKPAVAPTP